MLTSLCLQYCAQKKSQEFTDRQFHSLYNCHVRSLHFKLLFFTIFIHKLMEGLIFPIWQSRATSTKIGFPTAQFYWALLLAEHVFHQQHLAYSSCKKAFGSAQSSEGRFCPHWHKCHRGLLFPLKMNGTHPCKALQTFGVTLTSVPTPHWHQPFRIRPAPSSSTAFAPSGLLRIPLRWIYITALIRMAHLCCFLVALIWSSAFSFCIKIYVAFFPWLLPCLQTIEYLVFREGGWFLEDCGCAIKCIHIYVHFFHLFPA